MTQIHAGFMTIVAETERLTIRSWLPQQDAEQAFEIYSHPEVIRFLRTRIDSVAAAQALLQRWNTKAIEANDGSGFWAIVLRETAEIVGTVILIPLQSEEQPMQDYEIGWHLKRSAWGNGYATEAAKAVLIYGFQILKLPEIYAVARPENAASLRVMQRLGMTSIGRTTRYYNTDLACFKLEAASP